MANADMDMAPVEGGAAGAQEFPERGMVFKINHLFVPEASHEGMKKLVGHVYVEIAVVVVILVNTVMLVIYNPNKMAKTPESEKATLEVVDLCFTLFYTFEAVWRIMAFGMFDVGKGEEGKEEEGDDEGLEVIDEDRSSDGEQMEAAQPAPAMDHDLASYWSSYWNRLDLFVIATAYITYMMEHLFAYTGIISKTTMLRALRVLRIMHIFRFLSGIRAILSSLGRATTGMGNIVLMFFFFYSIFAIINIGLFGGALRTACVSMEVASQCVPVEQEVSNIFIWGGKQCEVLEKCPISFMACKEPNVCMIVGQGTRGGFAGYDNLASALLSLFIATTGDNWQDITWLLYWSPVDANMLAYPLMLIIQILCTMVAMNIFVAVICDAFDEVRQEGQTSAFAEESEIEAVEAAKEEMVESDEWQTPRPVGWTAPGYQSDAVEKIIQTTAFGSGSTLLILMNVIALSVVHHGMAQGQVELLEVADIIFTIVFDIEMILKVVGLGFKRYSMDGFNKIDLIVNIACTIGLLSFLVGDSDGALMNLMGAFRLSRVLRVMKLLSKVEMLRELLEVVMGSWVAVANLCVFIIYCLFVFSLFGMHMFGDMRQFDDKDSFLNDGPGQPRFLDEGTGTYAVPRPTFENFIMAFSTCFLMMTGDRWKVTMYTYMQTTGIEAVIFFVMLWTVCSCIMINLFVAVIVENFSVAEEEMMERQKLTYEKRTIPPPPGNAIRSFFIKAGCGAKLEAIEAEVGNGGKSYFVFAPDSGVRAFCTSIVQNEIFEYVIMVIIFGNSCMIAAEGPPGTMSSDMEDTFKIIDITLLIIFWVEFFMRSISMGFMLTKEAYIANHWNKLDFIVITTGLLSTVLHGTAFAEAANIFRLFRLLRPLRLLNKIEGMRVIIEALVNSAGGLLGVILLGMVFYLMFAILGVSLFAGKFYRCDDMGDPTIYQPRGTLDKWRTDVWGRDDCVGSYSYEAECPDPTDTRPGTYMLDGVKMCVHMGQPKWRIAQGYSFDSVPKALQTLFLVGTLAGWSECLYLTMDTTALDQQPIREFNQYAALYYIAFIFICSFALINLFVGVLIFLFGVSSGTSLQTEAQQTWVMTQSLLAKTEAVKEPVPPENGLQATFYGLINHPWFDGFITSTILANVGIMMMNYFPEPASHEHLVEYLNYACLGIFTVEMFCKLIGLGPVGYIENHWNKVDCFVVLSSWVFIVIAVISGGPNPLAQFAKLLRVARIALLIKRFQDLQQIFKLFFVSLPAACYIIMLLCLLFFIYACLGMYLFGHLTILPSFDIGPSGRGVRSFCAANMVPPYTEMGPDGSGVCGFGNYDNRGNFRDFFSAVQLLLQLCTGEDFLLIVTELELQPPFCIPKGGIYPATGEVSVHGTCGVNGAGFAFQATFFLLSNWLLLNMVIGVIMENYGLIKKADALELTDADVQDFMKTWEEATEELPTERLPASGLKQLCLQLGEPLGMPEGKREAAAFMSAVYHELEKHFALTFEEQKLGYTFAQVLEVLAIVKIGGADALSYEELLEVERLEALDRNAKIAIGSLRMWRAQKENKLNIPDETERMVITRSALALRMKLLAKAKAARASAAADKAGGGDEALLGKGRGERSPSELGPESIGHFNPVAAVDEALD